MLNIGQCIKEKMLKQERRQETNGISIWSYNIANNFLSSYTKGMNPFPTKEANCILCTRTILQRRRLCYFS